MSERRIPVVRSTDMSEDMQTEANEVAVIAVSKFDLESEIANFITTHFNRKFHPTWHCIAGRNFSANFSHKTKNYYYFTLDQTSILLWKS